METGRGEVEEKRRFWTTEERVGGGGEVERRGEERRRGESRGRMWRKSRRGRRRRALVQDRISSCSRGLLNVSTLRTFPSFSRAAFLLIDAPALRLNPYFRGWRSEQTTINSLAGSFPPTIDELNLSGRPPGATLQARQPISSL